MPISNIKSRTLEERGLDDNLGFIAVASELVQCDAQYKEIVASFLARVAVVDDMDSAIGIAKKYKNRFKIVTLDGQVINPGGSMTGGSRARGAGILSRANMIEELEAQAKKIKADYDDCAAEYKLAAEEANRAAAQMQAAQAELMTAKEDKIRTEGEGRLIAGRISALNSQLAALANEKENANGRIMLFEQAYKENEGKTSEIRTQIDAAENRLEQVSGDAKGVLEQREALRAQTENINLEILTLAKDSQAAKLSIEELRLQKSTQSGRVKSIEDDIKEIEAKNAALIASVESIKKRPRNSGKNPLNPGKKFPNLSSRETILINARQSFAHLSETRGRSAKSSLPKL